MTHPSQPIKTLTEHTRRVSALSRTTAALAEDEVDRALEAGAAFETVMRDRNRPAGP